MNLKQLLFLKGASVGREISFTYTIGAYIERYGSEPYMRTACSPFNGSNPNKYAAGYVVNQEYYSIQNKLEDEVDKYPIRFGDANKIILDVPDYIRATAFFVTSLEKTGGYAKFIDGDINPYDSSIPLGKREIIIPEGADSFGFSLFYPDGFITDDIMKSIKVKAIKADWIERLITGNPVSFTPNAERDLLKFDVPLTCSQSGSGDPSPSNVRPITGISAINIWHKGKNLIDDSIKYQYSSASLAVGNQYDFTIRLKAGTYTLSTEFFNGAHYGAFIREEHDPSQTEIWYSGSGLTSKSFTIPKDGMYRFWFYRSGGVYPENIGHCQIELGDEATTYEAYNEGTTYQIAFPALGKNLFDANDDKKLAYSSSYNKYSVVNGNIVLTGNSTGGYIMPCLPNTTYTYSVTSTYTGTNLAYRVYASDEYPTSLSSMEQIMNVLSSNSANTFTTGATIKWLVIGFYYSYSSSIGTITLSNVQVERAINILQNKTAVRGVTSIYIGQDTANVYPNHLVTGTVYSMSYECDGTNIPQIYIQENGGSAVLAGNGKQFTFSSGKTGDYRIYVYVQGGITRVTNFQLSTITKKEPYNNTVYGGTLDVATGTLTVEWMINSKKWKELTASTVGETMSQRLMNFDREVVVAGASGASSANICNVAKYLWNGLDNTTPHFYTGYSPTDNVYRAYVIMPNDIDIETVITIVSRLVTPYTVQLDPVTIQTMIGTNTIWTNINGSNTIKYLKKEG